MQHQTPHVITADCLGTMNRLPGAETDKSPGVFDAESSEVSPHIPGKGFSVHTDTGVDQGKAGD